MKNLRKIREEHGAGEWGTPELTNKYKSETPGQEETVEESLKRKQDLVRVTHGAMSQADFDAKWKKPKVKNKLAGPGGVYKNLVRSEGVQTEEGLKDACWKGYEAIGMKMKNGRKVPNCVPKEEAQTEGHAEDAQAAHQSAHAALKQGDIETYHKEMDKKFASHQAAAAEAGKKPVKTYEETDEEKNLKITKHEKAAVEAEKRGDKDAQKWHLERAKSLKSVKEGKEPDAQKHLVTVTVTDPQHPMTAKRKEKIMKRVKVTAKDPKDAVAKAEAHYKKHGFKVHDSLHHSVVSESLDTDEFVDSYDPEKEKSANENHADKDPQENVAENSSGEKQELTPEDKKAIEKIKLLIRLGMLEMSDLPIAVRVLKRVELDEPVTATQERQVLSKLLNKFTDYITQDDFIFRKVRQTVVSTNPGPS
jgi:hypothetical protein